MQDSHWHQDDGWTEWAQEINGVEVRYVGNRATGEWDDFKIKDWDQ